MMTNRPVNATVYFHDLQSADLFTACFGNLFLNKYWRTLPKKDHVEVQFECEKGTFKKIKDFAWLKKLAKDTWLAA